jgi:single-stranded-DNA-specific exonuclease
MIKGSGRSIPNFHLRDALDLVSKRAPKLIDKFGGHAMAAGLSLREENFAEFAAAFEAVGREWLSSAALEQMIETDGSLESAYFSLDFIALLETQVWGQGFAPPVLGDEFRVMNQRVLKDRHLKLQLEREGRQFDAIWFNHADSLPHRARIAYRLDANEFNGRTQVQLMVEFAEPLG